MSTTDMHPTSRQVEILELIVEEGLTNGEIAQRLFLGENTVKTHLRKLYELIGANDRAHAVALALRLGVVGDRPLKVPDPDPEIERLRARVAEPEAARHGR